MRGVVASSHPLHALGTFPVDGGKGFGDFAGHARPGPGRCGQLQRRSRCQRGERAAGPHGCPGEERARSGLPGFPGSAASEGRGDASSAISRARERKSTGREGTCLRRNRWPRRNPGGLHWTTGRDAQPPAARCGRSPQCISGRSGRDALPAAGRAGTRRGVGDHAKAETTHTTPPIAPGHPPRLSV